MRRGGLVAALSFVIWTGVHLTACGVDLEGDPGETSIDGGGGVDAGGGAGGGEADAGGGVRVDAGGEDRACSGRAAACSSDSDCSGDFGVCSVGVCDNGCCRAFHLPSGTVARTQIAHDCKRLVCDGEGAATEVSDDYDLPLLTDCWIPTCSSGTPHHEPKSLETACNDGSQICDGAGSCVDRGCTNGVRDGDETDVDCGGAGCAPCADGKACESGGDCASGACDSASKTCSAPACDDGTKNGDETDTDCGGPQCAPCGNGRACAVDSDCASGFCGESECKDSCNDGVKNGAETGIDCGGPCLLCDGDEGCVHDGDCKSGECDQDQNKCLGLD